jgi:hypothetical protein
LTERQEIISVLIRHKGVEENFSGTVEEVWLLLSKFFNEFLPSFEIATKLWLSIDMQKLAQGIEGIIAFSKEGANLLVPKNKLTDNEALILWLLANYVGFKLGLVESGAVSKEELQAKLGKSGKITSTRLGELVKNDFAKKTDDDKFSLTTFGVIQTQKEILQKIRAKTGI